MKRKINNQIGSSPHVVIEYREVTFEKTASKIEKVAVSFVTANIVVTS